MLNISELHLASIIMDSAAVFILLGMIVYTGLYRQRGRIDDRLFFWLSIIAIIMSVSDAITYVFDGGTVPGSALISLIFNNVFFITFELFAGMVVVYLDYHLNRKEEKFGKRGLIIMIPAMLSVVMILVNNIVHFLYWVDFSSNEYFEYAAYPAVFAAPLIYAVIAAVFVLRIDKRSAVVLAILILLRVVSRFLLQGVSSTAVIFAMGLVFIHLNVMREPFYEEEE